MIVWGGASAGKLYADGAAYDPATDTWRVLSPSPLEERTAHTAVWTGKEMIIWGGCCGRTEYGDGAAYDPAIDRWRLLPPAPVNARTEHTAVWTGREMIVWGGHVFEEVYADGAAYRPKGDRWRTLAATDAPARFAHSATWTERSMVVWGGADMEGGIDGGYEYFPSSDHGALTAWHAMPQSPIGGRSLHSATWTGKHVIYWGGCCEDSAGLESSSGLSWDPGTFSWRRIAEASLIGRHAHSAVWTGTSVILWGGITGIDTAHADGSAFRPGERSWTPLPPAPISARSGHTAVWTGGEMIVWGGCCDPKRRGLGDGAALQIREAGPAPAASPGDLEETEGESDDPVDVNLLTVALAGLAGVLLGLVIRLKKRTK